MRPLPRCFQCGDPVLNLQGQDVVLDTYHLRPQPSPPDQEILDAGAFGDVHLQCFVGSRWGPLCAELLRENFEGVRGFVAVRDADGLVILRHKVLGAGRTVAIRDDGWHASFEDDDVAARRTVPGGALLPVRHDLNLDVTGQGPVLDEIVRTLRGGNSYPLLGLVDGL